MKRAVIGLFAMFLSAGAAFAGTAARTGDASLPATPHQLRVLNMTSAEGAGGSGNRDLSRHFVESGALSRHQQEVLRNLRRPAETRTENTIERSV